MLNKKSVLQSIFVTIALALTIQSCASTKSATNIHQTQIYLSKYDHTIDAVHRALNSTNMNIYNEKKLSKDVYRITFYRQRYKFNADPNAKKAVSFMTELTIRKLDKKKTQIKIDEDDQSDMVANSIPDSPGKDLLKELNKIITNQAQVQTKKAS